MSNIQLNFNDPTVAALFAEGSHTALVNHHTSHVFADVVLYDETAEPAWSASSLTPPAGRVTRRVQITFPKARPRHPRSAGVDLTEISVPTAWVGTILAQVGVHVQAAS